MILVDSSVLVGFFREQATPAVRYLAEIEASGEAASWALPLVCMQEILQGARGQRARWCAGLSWVWPTPARV